jgi:hypothetical protein
VIDRNDPLRAEEDAAVRRAFDKAFNVLQYLDERGFRLANATLFADGSGHLAISIEDAPLLTDEIQEYLMDQLQSMRWSESPDGREITLSSCGGWRV